jgi:Fibronectin type III domain
MCVCDNILCLLSVRTQGHSPGIPKPTDVIFPNSTFVALKLSAWPENGCPLLYFVVQYRVIHDDGDGEWNLVSNALKPQKRFIISNLQPSTMYQLRIEAYNIAGHSSQDFTFVTLTKDGGERAER